MGPARGSKKRKRSDKKNEVKPVASEPRTGDWWDDFSRRITGPLSTTSNGATEFESLFKISRKTFNYICSLVREDFLAKTSHFSFADGKKMSVDDQVAIALRRLSSGESLVNIGNTFGINHSTVSQITWRFVESMEERGVHHLRWPNSEEMNSIKSKFEQIRALPNCCGVVDTTHIMMCLSSADNSNTVWLDYEKNHSMILQVVVDPEMRFRDVVTGWPGFMNESQVLRSSGFFKMCEKGAKLNGEKMKISQGSEVREYVIGDGAFPLLPWLLTPYKGKNLSASDSRADFNKRHAATRMVAQRALTKFKAMWKIIQGEMWRPDKHRLPRIIFVCCLLHNIIIDLEDEASGEIPFSHSHHHDVSYKHNFCDVAVKDGIALRHKLSQYFSGSLPP